MIKSNNKFTDYIFIILLILNGGTFIKVLGLTALFQIITVLVMFLLLLNNGRIFIKKTGLSILVLVLIFFIIHLFHFFKFNLNNFFSNQLFNFIVLIIIGVFVGNQFFNRTEIFVFRLSKVLKILILHAIISSVLISFLPTKNVLFKTPDDSAAYVGYFYTFFQRVNIIYTGSLDTAMKTLLGFKFYRAHGLFWESGVFATYLNIYVFINFFILQNLKSLRISIPAIFLAWSTTGLLVFILQFFVFIKDYKKGNKRFLYKKYIIGTIAIALMSFVIIDNFNNKFNGEDIGSAAQRYNDTVGAIEVIKDNPLLGIGIDFQNFEKHLKSVNVGFSSVIGNNFKNARKDEINFSNSFLRLFVYFGIIVGGLLLLALYSQPFIKKNKWLFLLITILSVSTSPILFLSFHFTFIISGVKNLIPFLKTKKLII